MLSEIRHNNSYFLIFQGDPVLNTMIQWIAASASGKNLRMHSFDPEEFVEVKSRLFPQDNKIHLGKSNEDLLIIY